jgi:hypothetical protein
VNLRRARGVVSRREREIVGRPPARVITTLPAGDSRDDAAAAGEALPAADLSMSMSSSRAEDTCEDSRRAKRV